jgi:glyoxylase-like metal-dependent hydrolase (beta-lactamase superfamily II)
MQPVNCVRQEPVQLASKFAGQLTVTHWKKASLQVFATVQMPGPFCANASTHRTATATTTARMIEARLSKGTISERLSQHRNAPMLSTALGAPERTPMPKLTRRSLVAGSAVALMAGAGPAAAEAPPANKQAPGLYRYKIGAFELTALYDGIWYRPITDTFIRNAPFADVEHALDVAFMPHDKLETPFTTLIVNTGKKLVLIDTGTGGQIAPTAGMITDNLAAAGISPKAVDQIVISHFHPDHINGIKDKDNALVFPNAEIMVPAPEWDYWMDDATMNAAPADQKLTFLNQRRIFADIAKQVTRYTPGKEVSSGIVTLPAPGHTPGHTVFAIHSGDASLMVLSDTAQHPAIFARHPDWQAAFDVDGNAAVATRKKLFDRAAADRMLVTGYHFPFPACGHLVKTASGYEHVPVPWQPVL